MSSSFNLSLPTPLDATVPVGHFKGRSILSTTQFSRVELNRIFSVAHHMSDVHLKGPGMLDIAKGKILTTLFYEPSTRTASSFHCAMLRLGGQVLPVQDVANSSVSKGETLEDTVRCLQCYTDVIVLRHPQMGSAARAAKVLNVPLLNAGDGVGEHPTQALLDIFTIAAERRTILEKQGSALGADFGLDGLHITMVGDLKNGRTVHSLSKLLTHFKVHINFVSPASLSMPDEVKTYVTSRGVVVEEHSSLESCLATTDILYVTRVQKERFSSEEEYNKVKDAFIITADLLKKYNAPDTLRILHPLPRVNELHEELDNDPKAAYFRQMQHGLHVRMALIALVLGLA